MNGAGEQLEGLPVTGDLLAGKYRIERLLGKGGMGAVFAAQHELLCQRVAVKVLLSQIAREPEAVARFLNEARAAARIASDHIARVMDVGTLDDGTPYMVLEYLDGMDLAEHLQISGPFSVEGATDCVLQAIEAVAQAHALGIVHRDLKPANLFLARQPDGSHRVKVLDFGISKAQNPFASSGAHVLTSTKTVLGSPMYMSPEQLRSSKNVDTRADVWGLGVILYELLAGAPPFGGETLGELFAAILEQTPQSLRARRSDVPPALDALVQRCLARQAEARVSDVAELARGLAPFAPESSRANVERIVRTVSSIPPRMPSDRAAAATPAAAISQQAHAAAHGAGGTAAAWGKPTGSQALSSRSSRGRRGWIVAGIVALAALAVAARAFLFVHHGRDGSPPEPSAATQPVEPPPAPSAASVAPLPPAMSVRAVPPASALPPPVASAAPPLAPPLAPPKAPRAPRGPRAPSAPTGAAAPIPAPTASSAYDPTRDNRRN
jgi:serine/threonine protein kinase